MRISEEEGRSRSLDALKAVGLEGYEEKPPHHLSVGEKKRAAIATVLAMKPRILILDEPTANLDPKSRVDLANILSNLHAHQSMTLITATHDVNFLSEVADRAYVLNKGRMIADGPLREIFSNAKIMDEANLEFPIVTRLFHLLAQRKIMITEPIPFTLEEAISEIRRRC